jgi:hypothetical protein
MIAIYSYCHATDVRCLLTWRQSCRRGGGCSAGYVHQLCALVYFPQRNPSYRRSCGHEGGGYPPGRNVRLVRSPCRSCAATATATCSRTRRCLKPLSWPLSVVIFLRLHCEYRRNRTNIKDKMTWRQIWCDQEIYNTDLEDELVQMGPSGLRHVLTSAARKLGSWVWISLEAWMCVRVFLCCVVLGRQRPCVGLIPRPRSPTNCPNRFISFRKLILKRNRPRGLILKETTTIGYFTAPQTLRVYLLPRSCQYR